MNFEFGKKYVILYNGYPNEFRFKLGKLYPFEIRWSGRIRDSGLIDDEESFWNERILNKYGLLFAKSNKLLEVLFEN